MQLFLDSVDINDIIKYHSYGIIDGITTNPSLMASSAVSFKEIVNELCRVIRGNISIEVVANDYDQMIIEGNKIASIANNIVIKLPLTWDGIKACKYFSERGKKVNMTLCFSSNQALIAAKAGAYYVSPFIGRLEDIGRSGIDLIKDIRVIYDNYGYKTKILAASIRSVEHINQVAVYGADAATVPSKIIATILDHDLTKSGLEKFNQDWQNSGKQIRLI